MRTLLWLGGLAGTLAVLAVVITAHLRRRPDPAPGQKRLHVVLIGASIGQSWRLADWPARVQAPLVTAESITAWQFDKAEALEELLRRPARTFRFTRTYVKSLFQPPPRPADIAILKECSSYFPGNLSLYRNNVQRWVGQLQAHKVQPVLATVVPVTRARAGREPGKQEMLLEYNRWVREYAREHGIPVLDLESALREEGEGAYLLEQFAMPDGSHLQPNTYAVLDQVLLDLLSRMHYTMARMVGNCR